MVGGLSEGVGGQWFIDGLIKQSIGAVAIGCGIGLLVAWALEFAERVEVLESSSILAVSLALTLFTLGFQ